MAVKYRLDYKDNHDNDCRVDISKSTYSGEIIPVRGVAEKACVIVRDCSDDPYDTIINTKAQISMYQDESLSIDIFELQQAQDREFTVQFYINGFINFSGFMLADGIQMSFQSAPFELNINATDGLMLLSSIPYQPGSLPGDRNIIHYLRDILFTNNNLRLPLPIRWVNGLTNDRYPTEEDVFSGTIEWSERGEGFTDYNGTQKDCMYILEGMLKSMQCRIVQSNGRWVIWRINDVVSGSFKHYETPGNTGALVITESPVINEIKSIGGDDTFDYRFIQEDAIITVSPALKTVTTKYDQDQRENILPNGNMDIVQGITSQPIYWTLGGDTTNATFISVEGGLGGNGGSHVKITNAVGAGEARFEYYPNNYLPIDTDVLYSYINFGFKFSILNGATVDSNGFIVWSGTPFKVKVWYFASPGVIYFLNENGFWNTTVTDIQITVPNLKLGDVAQIDFNARQNIILPLPTVSPTGMTQEPFIYVSFDVPSGRSFLLDDVYLNTENNSDVYDATINTGTNTAKEEYTLNISSSHNGFYVSNFMTSFSNSGFEKFYSDSKLSQATLTEMNSHAVLRNRYKPSLVFEGSIYSGQYNYDEIYTLQLSGDKKFLPLRSSWNTETNVVNLSMVEIRNDGTGISTRHYGSNANTQLSN